jgi:hypothetical protein
MKHDTSKLRQKIRNIEEARTEHVQSILQEQGSIQGGSLVKIHRKCGKPNCHCASGSGHPTTYLSSKEDGKTRMVYIASAIEQAITQQTQRYRHLRQHRSSLAKLAQQSLGLIDQLQEALHTTKPVVTSTMAKSRKR